MSFRNWIDELPEEICAAVKSRMSQLTLVDGEVVYHRGESSTEQYLVISGAVRMRVNSCDGREWMAISFQPGDSFGETSALDNDIRPHDAITQGQTQLAVLQQKDLKELRALYPEISEALLLFMCSRVRIGYTLSTDAALMSLPIHMATRLLLISTEYGNRASAEIEQNLKLTHQDLAHMMGASRQAVSKILKQWEAKDLIRISYGHIFLCNIDELKTLADEH